MYSLLRSGLFQLEPETAHRWVLNALRLLPSCLWTKVESPVRLMGLDFANQVGLSAGFDVSGDYIKALGKLGFGFIEIGGVTPRPQAGHPRPRICRLESHESLWNCVGFPNPGAAYVASQLKTLKKPCVVGVNIAKNHDTEPRLASTDYVQSMQILAPHVDYITINVSSPNTTGLRDLQQAKPLHELLSRLKEEQSSLMDRYCKRLPLVLKVAPDLSEANVDVISRVVLDHEIEGITTTNTTISPACREAMPFRRGGYSGQLLKPLSLQVQQWFCERLSGSQTAVIACGGVMREEEAQERMALGAHLIQIYSALIYHGPWQVARLAECIADEVD